MVRAGLGKHWNCIFSNDFDHKKSRTYIDNWGPQSFTSADIRALTSDDLPGHADLAWASFPCQDLSLAGGGAGLRGDRSGTFWPFCQLMTELTNEQRPPTLIVLENVCGTLTSHKGKDFATICSAFKEASYRFGAVVIDAALFVPQSRPRLFLVAIHEAKTLPKALTKDSPSSPWHTPTLCRAYDGLSAPLQDNWIWWNIPTPPVRHSVLSDIIEDNPTSVDWHTEDQTQRLLNMMTDANIQKVDRARELQRKAVGCLYKRTRKDELGRRIQRAEVRFDDIAGCLRTPAGGSSRQLILVVDRDITKSRLLSTRETARLMGLPENYRLPENYNEAYHLTGDGVVVPVVRHLAEHLFEPILKSEGTTNSEWVAA